MYNVFCYCRSIRDICMTHVNKYSSGEELDIVVNNFTSSSVKVPTTLNRRHNGINGRSTCQTLWLFNHLFNLTGNLAVYFSIPLRNTFQLPYIEYYYHYYLRDIKVSGKVCPQPLTRTTTHENTENYSFRYCSL